MPESVWGVQERIGSFCDDSEKMDASVVSEVVLEALEMEEWVRLDWEGRGG